MWLTTFLVACYCATALAQVEVPVREIGFSDQYKSENTLGEYTFGYNEDHTSGGSFRRETSDRMGNKVGSYGLRIGDGRVRIVNYVADKNGFRADVISNEPGLETQDSNQFSKITRKRILGVLVPGFRYSSIAPHVTFERSPPQAKNYRLEILKDVSSLPNAAKPHSIDGDGMANRYAGAGNTDVFPNEGFHGDDAYSKPHSFRGEGMINEDASKYSVGGFPNEGSRGDDANSKPHTFDGEAMINPYAGRGNPDFFPNEGFHGEDAYSKPQSFGGDGISNKHTGKGNLDVFPNEGLGADNAYSEHQLNRGNLYTDDGKLSEDPFLDGEYSHQSSESIAPNRTSGLRLEQKASDTSAKVQTEDMHSASTSTSELVNGTTRIQNETDYQEKNQHSPESATMFGDLNSFPSTIVASKAAGKKANFQEGIDNNHKNATVSTATDA